jgi:uncharacterized protein (DUF362 family)
VDSKVAVIRFKDGQSPTLKRGLELIGGIDDLDDEKRSVVVKVGVFNPEADHHSSVDVVRAIIRSFGKAPHVFVAESDNYKGTGSERLQIWRQLFTGKVVPFSLSEDTETQLYRIAGEDVGLSHVLFKPNVLISTHVLRTFERGSILKNLFGLIPDTRKSRFHKKLPAALADLYEAVGGVDLAVMDGTSFWHGWGGPTTRMNTILVGRDAVAVDTVGSTLAGMNPKKMSVIQEFAKRSLGQSNIERIEIVGADFEALKAEFEAAKRSRPRPKKNQGPKTWSGLAHCALQSLVEERFFEKKNERTLEDIITALEEKKIPTAGREQKILGLLARRVKKGVLRRESDRDKIFWREET